MEKVKLIIRDFADIADFVTIYIQEAHPLEEWHIKGQRFESMSQHKTMEDRVEAAKMLTDLDLMCPLLVDPMDNQNCLKYAAFPERLYILNDQTVVYFGSVGPFDYKPQDIRNWLERFRNDIK